MFLTLIIESQQMPKVSKSHRSPSLRGCTWQRADGCSKSQVFSQPQLDSATVAASWSLPGFDSHSRYQEVTTKCLGGWKVVLNTSLFCRQVFELIWWFSSNVAVNRLWVLEGADFARNHTTHSGLPALSRQSRPGGHELTSIHGNPGDPPPMQIPSHRKSQALWKGLFCHHLSLNNCWGGWALGGGGPLDSYNLGLGLGWILHGHPPQRSAKSHAEARRSHMSVASSVPSVPEP